MKIFRTEEYTRMENPNPGKAYRPEILAKEHGAKNLGGSSAFSYPEAKFPITITTAGNR